MLIRYLQRLLASNYSVVFQVFVSLVICLITAVVILFYVCIMPIVLENYYTIYAIIHIIYGHYLLVMISFHYFKAVTTKSSAPSKVKNSNDHLYYV